MQIRVKCGRNLGSQEEEETTRSTKFVGPILTGVLIFHFSLVAQLMFDQEVASISIYIF